MRGEFLLLLPHEDEREPVKAFFDIVMAEVVTASSAEEAAALIRCGRQLDAIVVDLYIRLGEETRKLPR